jgi:hypothetical protein
MPKIKDLFMETIIASPEPNEPEEPKRELTYAEQAENFRKDRREALTKVASTVAVHQARQKALTHVASALRALVDKDGPLSKVHAA